MPDLTNVDLWKDADFTVASEGTSDIISVGKVPYIAYVTESNGSYKINIKKYVESKLAKFEWPYKYDFRKSLPKTKMGKIDFKKLQNEEFEEKEKKDV